MPRPRIGPADPARADADAVMGDRAYAGELAAQLLQIGLQSIDLNQVVRGQLWRTLVLLYGDEIRREGGTSPLAVRRLLEDLPGAVFVLQFDGDRRDRSGGPSPSTRETAP